MKSLLFQKLMPVYRLSLQEKNVPRSSEISTMPIISSVAAVVHESPNKYSSEKELLFPAHGICSSLFINKKRTLEHTKVLFVRMVGLEPTRGHPRKILSLVRLPFRHIRMCEMFASQQSISYHPLSILSIPFLNFFTKNYSPPSPVIFILHFLPIICSF